MNNTTDEDADTAHKPSVDYNELRAKLENSLPAETVKSIPDSMLIAVSSLNKLELEAFIERYNKEFLPVGTEIYLLSTKDMTSYVVLFFPFIIGFYTIGYIIKELLNINSSSLSLFIDLASVIISLIAVPIANAIMLLRGRPKNIAKQADEIALKENKEMIVNILHKIRIKRFSYLAELNSMMEDRGDEDLDKIRTDLAKKRKKLNKNLSNIKTEVRRGHKYR